jgi:hypothetical protein
MSTSIQEQDLVQTIKELQQRVNNLERQQRTIGGWKITPSSIQTGNYNTNGTRYLGDNGLSVSDKFRVDDEGNMNATNATVTGSFIVPPTDQYTGSFINEFGITLGDFNIADTVLTLNNEFITFSVYDNGNFDSLISLSIGENTNLGKYLAISFAETLFCVGADKLVLDFSNTPASSTAPGRRGTICWDGSYIYVCVATDTWKRVAIGTW